MPTGSRSSPSEEEIMDIKIKILEEKREYLCKFLNPETHFPYLRSVSILSQEDQERIQCQETSKTKANKFLDILTSKGPAAYEHLVFSLKKDKTQMFIVEKLNKEFESKKCLLMGGGTSQKMELAVDVRKLPKPPKQFQKEEFKDKESSLNSGCKNCQVFDKNLKSSCNCQEGSYHTSYGQREITPKEVDARQTEKCNDTIQSLQKQELDRYNSIAKNNDSLKQVKLKELMRKPDETNA